MTLNKLHETASLSRWDLDVGNLTEALEEGAKFVLGNVARKATDENSGVIWVRELVHRLWGTVVSHRRVTHVVLVAAHGPRTSSPRHASAHSSSWCASTSLVLWCGSRNAHWSIATVDALHLLQCALLVTLVGKANKTVTTGHSTDRIGHNLGRFAGREAVLEKGDQDVFVDLGSEIANEN